MAQRKHPSIHYSIPLLLGSMYFWSWLIQLNRSYKYNGKIVRTGISTLNGHISKLVALRKKLKKINCNYISILGLSRWFRNFPQVSHFSQNMPPRLVSNGKFFFAIAGTSWMGWGRVEWDWHMGMFYLTSLNPQLFKNIAYVGSFKHFLCSTFFTCILQLDQDQR